MIRVITKLVIYNKILVTKKYLTDNINNKIRVTLTLINDNNL